MKSKTLPSGVRVPDVHIKWSRPKPKTKHPTKKRMDYMFDSMTCDNLHSSPSLFMLMREAAPEDVASDKIVHVVDMPMLEEKTDDEQK